MNEFDVLPYLLQNEDTQSQEEEGRQQLPFVPYQDPRRAPHRGLEGGQAAGEFHPSWRTYRHVSISHVSFVTVLKLYIKNMLTVLCYRAS